MYSVEYMKSLTYELISIKDRVRNFIGDNHWVSVGNHHEQILFQLIKEKLPNTVGICTGFVINIEDSKTLNTKRITKQIDIIIYDRAFSPLYKFNDFGIIESRNVLGIIEVKAAFKGNQFKNAVESANYNGEIINKKSIFNGIFSFEIGDLTINENKISKPIVSEISNNFGQITNISFGMNSFCKLWESGFLSFNEDTYRFYSLEDLSYGYFVSNLLERCYYQLDYNRIGIELDDILYPFEFEKEAYKLSLHDITKD